MHVYRLKWWMSIQSLAALSQLSGPRWDGIASAFIEAYRRDMDLEARARTHAALADPHRLAIVDALALGDLTPGELGRLAGIPSNLLAHHLRILEAAGLTESRASSGDARRRYVVLRAEGLSHLVPAPPPPVAGVLFVCTHNSARSQVAAALWRHLTGEAAESAGAEPAPRVHPGAVRAARRVGIDIGDEIPKGYGAIAADPGLVVSVCDRAREGGVPFDAPTLHWSVPDPVADGRARAFAATVDEISGRVVRLADARRAA
jgi:protein-tyrosine-phosphatase/DNA-binding HxlR family transcriptional regulator